MKLFIAERTDLENAGPRLASGSFTNIKQQMKGTENALGEKIEGGQPEADAAYAVTHYVIKTDVDTIVQLVIDVGKLKTEWVKRFHINKSGQLREDD